MSGQVIILRNQTNKDLLMRIAAEIKTDPDNPLEVEIRRHKKKRSLDQNALYWMWLGIIGKNFGEDAEYFHEFFKLRYVDALTKTIMGCEVALRSTTKLDPAQMSAYLDSIFVFAAHEGIVLPSPEDRWAA